MSGPGRAVARHRDHLAYGAWQATAIGVRRLLIGLAVASMPSDSRASSVSLVGNGHQVIEGSRLENL